MHLGGIIEILKMLDKSIYVNNAIVSQIIHLQKFINEYRNNKYRNKKKIIYINSLIKCVNSYKDLLLGKNYGFRFKPFC